MVQYQQRFNMQQPSANIINIFTTAATTSAAQLSTEEEEK
jgi:hypothetical protein